MNVEEKVAKLEALLARVKKNAAQPRATLRANEAPQASGPSARDLRAEPVAKPHPRAAEVSRPASASEPNVDNWLDNVSGVLGAPQAPEPAARPGTRTEPSPRDPSPPQALKATEPVAQPSNLSKGAGESPTLSRSDSAAGRTRLGTGPSADKAPVAGGSATPAKLVPEPRQGGEIAASTRPGPEKAAAAPAGSAFPKATEKAPAPTPGAAVSKPSADRSPGAGPHEAPAKAAQRAATPAGGALGSAAKTGTTPQAPAVRTGVVDSHRGSPRLVDEISSEATFDDVTKMVLPDLAPAFEPGLELPAGIVPIPSRSRPGPTDAPAVRSSREAATYATPRTAERPAPARAQESPAAPPVAPGPNKAAPAIDTPAKPKVEKLARTVEASPPPPPPPLLDEIGIQPLDGELDVPFAPPQDAQRSLDRVVSVPPPLPAAGPAETQLSSVAEPPPPAALSPEREPERVSPVVAEPPLQPLAAYEDEDAATQLRMKLPAELQPHGSDVHEVAPPPPAVAHVPRAPEPRVVLARESQPDGPTERLHAASEATSPSRKINVPAESSYPLPVSSPVRVPLMLAAVAVLCAGAYVAYSKGMLRGVATPNSVPTVVATAQAPRSAEPPTTTASAGAVPAAATVSAAAASAEPSTSASATAAPSATGAVDSGAALAPTAVPSSPASAAATAAPSAVPSAIATAPTTPAGSGDESRLSPGRGYLVVDSPTPAVVYISGVSVGAVGEPIETECGAKFVRLGALIATGTEPKPNGVVWISEGKSVIVECKKTTRTSIAVTPRP